ncbi:RNA-directed DNA polymerase, eukaryota [Tanacetum coccineum]
MKDKATLFFFTNFPNSWDLSALWKMFGSFERRLKCILIGNERLVINHAKFAKGSYNYAPPADFPPINPDACVKPKQQHHRPGNSFKEVMLGSRNFFTPRKPALIIIEEDKYIKCRLENCLVEHAKNLQVLQNVWDIMQNNGLGDCNVKYMGGLSLLFEWNSKEVVTKSLDVNEGLPIIGRNISSVKTIIKVFGKLVEIGKLDFDSKLLLPERFNTSRLISPPSSNDDEDSMFEEEFIGPSIANGDGLAPSGDRCSKLDSVYECQGGSPIVDVRPTVKNIISGLSPILNGHHPSKDSELAHFAPSNRPVPYVVEHVSDLNAHLGVDGDQELDELLSSFQRIFDMANEPHLANGKKKRTKHKKIKLAVGDTSCLHVLVSQNKDVTLDDDTQMKLIGKQLGYSFINKTKYDSFNNFLIRSFLPKPYTKYALASLVSASGGILTLWDNQTFTEEHKTVDRNFVGVVGSWHGVASKVGLVNIYAHQATSHKEALWGAIDGLISSFGAIWIIFGDFNVVRYVDERTESYFDISEANSFNDFTYMNGLVDIPLTHKCFTRLRLEIKSWTNNRLATQNHLKDDLLCKLANWDLKAKDGLINPNDGDKRDEWLMDLDHLDRLRTKDLKQKSRTRWVVEGDENFKFFHSLLKFKFSNSMIRDININGDWLCVEDACFLESFIYMNEVKEVVWSCDGPISLIGYVYKIISKIIANRLAKVISSIIGHNQSAFIAKRQIMDGCLIANEIVCIASIKDHKLLLFKVDFEKAFDSVNWKFLMDIKEQMGFSRKWRKWIISCISSASISVLINGSPLKEFVIEKGLRQGDPLSLFLVSFGRQGASSNAKNLMLILRYFEVTSGIKINLAKSRIFGIRVSLEDVEVGFKESQCGISWDKWKSILLDIDKGGLRVVEDGGFKTDLTTLSVVRWGVIFSKPCRILKRSTLHSRTPLSLKSRTVITFRSGTDWRSQLQARALNDLTSLVDLIGNLSLSRNGSDKWSWSYEASGKAIELVELGFPFYLPTLFYHEHCYGEYLQSRMCSPVKNYSWSFEVFAVANLEMEK